jgi:phage shock protein C
VWWLAEYFGIDPTLVRVGFVLLALAGGAGVLLYVAGMIIMPRSVQQSPSASMGMNVPKGGSAGLVGGVILIGVGLVLFLRNIGMFAWHSLFSFCSGFFLPFMLILVGASLLLFRRQPGSDQNSALHEQGTGQASPEPTTGAPSLRRMQRSRRDRKIFGVCGGFAEYFEIDPTVVRILCVVSAFLSFGLTLLAYILLAILVPEEPLLAEAR